MLKEKEGMVPAIVLTIICIITALALAATNTITSKKIQASELAAATEQMKTIFPEASEFKNVDATKVATISKEIDGVTNAFEAIKDGKTSGYVVMAESKGYGGALPIMVAIKSDKTISGVGIMSNNETPGLGKKVENPEFTAQFKGKSIDKNFGIKNLKENEQQLDAISGVTISSTSVSKSINKAIEAFNKLSK